MNNPPTLSPHFKEGDKVIYNDFPAKVLEVGYPVKEDNDHPGVLVEFDGVDVVPPQMGVPYRFLKHALTGGINGNTHCPVCKTAWKETLGQSNIWYDCLKCAKTKEDILKDLK